MQKWCDLAQANENKGNWRGLFPCRRDGGIVELNSHIKHMCFQKAEICPILQHYIV
jgi:hypothetical protein